MEKICCFCKHWTCSHSTGYDYSEYTWDTGNFDLSCAKGHYSEDNDMTTEHFRALILKAENCADFKVVTFETPNLGEWCAPGPADEQTQKWLLMFEDKDMAFSVFEDEQEARNAFASAESGGWNCHLFALAPRKAPNVEI